MALEATRLIVSTSFSETPGYLASLEGLSREREREREALEGLSLPISATSKAMSALELAELDARMAGR